MNIRRARLKDKAQIVAMMDEFNSYYYEEGIFTEEYKQFWEYKDKQQIFSEAAQEWLITQKYHLFVAEEDNSLIGYICGHVQERAPRVLDKEGYIDDWFVRKNWRKKGIGTALYTVLVKEFKQKHCNRLGLLAKRGNKNAINFYHSLGFIDESITMVKKLE